MLISFTYDFSPNEDYIMNQIIMMISSYILILLFFYAVLSAVTDILDESLIYIILYSVLLYHLYYKYCIFSTAVLHLCYFLLY